MSSRPGQPEGTKLDILKLLAKQELSAQGLAEALGVSATAVRQHLDTLEALAFVERRKQITQPSRPTYLYRLSARGSEAFPKRYDLLLSLLIEVIAEREGSQGVEEVVEAAARRFAERAESRFPKGDAAKRLRALLAWMEEELEWQADVTAEGHGRHRLVIYQCPFREISSRQPRVCDVFFRTLLDALHQGLQVEAAAPLPPPACCGLLVTLGGHTASDGRTSESGGSSSSAPG
jgi:predicted ArsR family transcriptional regulator